MLGRSLRCLLVARRLLLHQLLRSLPLSDLEAVHHFAIRALTEILLTGLEQLLLLQVLLQSLVRLGCVVVLVLSGGCLGDHIDVGLAAVTDGCELLLRMAWWLGSLVFRSWVEVSAAWLGNLFESISHPALALVDLHADRFLIWFTLQLLVLLGLSGVLEHVCVDLLNHKIVC